MPTLPERPVDFQAVKAAAREIVLSDLAHAFPGLPSADLEYIVTAALTECSIQYCRAATLALIEKWRLEDGAVTHVAR